MKESGNVDVVVSSKTIASLDIKKKRRRDSCATNLRSSSSPSSSTSLSSFSSSYGVSHKYLLFVTVSLIVFSLYADPWLHLILPQSSFAENSMEPSISILYNNSSNYPEGNEYKILNCSSSNMTVTCPINFQPKSNSFRPSNQTCPDYFRWIHEDLKTWKEKGIEQKMVENLPGSICRSFGLFRLVIVNGTTYIKQYKKATVTRDVFTLWGILQLLKLYPGRVPDLDLVFECDDWPSITKEKYPGNQSVSAQPLFNYCKNDSALDILFPDWTYWGWPEPHIQSWVPLSKNLKAGNLKKKWIERKPHAHWRGSLYNGKKRAKLVNCSSIDEWNAEIVHLSWSKAFRAHFKHTKLSKQCLHRYKIYIEGIGWSASEKHILACDSMTLLINPVHYGFFTRGLIPLKHYWPINPNNLCNSIKFAVDWGNNNTDKAQEVGKTGSEFILEQVNMKNVYDYMFHVLNEYAKLLKYKPSIPDGAVELCSEKFVCSPMGFETDLKIESMITAPAEEGPCNLPPPYDDDILQTLLDQKAKTKEVVEMLENGCGLE